MEAWKYLLQMVTQNPSVKANQITKDTMCILSVCDACVTVKSFICTNNIHYNYDVLNYVCFIFYDIKKDLASRSHMSLSAEGTK